MSLDIPNAACNTLSMNTKKLTMIVKHDEAKDLIRALRQLATIEMVLGHVEDAYATKQLAKKLMVRLGGKS